MQGHFYAFFHRAARGLGKHFMLIYGEVLTKQTENQKFISISKSNTLTIISIVTTMPGALGTFAENISK